MMDEARVRRRWSDDNRYDGLTLLVDVTDAVSTGEPDPRENVADPSLAGASAEAAVEPASTGPALDDSEVGLLRLLANGLDLSSIGREKGVSESTVKRQIAQIQSKLGVDNRIQAVVAAAQRGLL